MRSPPLIRKVYELSENDVIVLAIVFEKDVIVASK